MCTPPNDAGPDVEDIEDSAAPGPTHFLGPLEITVLSTDRDAGRTIGEGFHPADFRQVLTTLNLTNTSSTVVSQVMLEFEFGAPDGANFGYSPWDDWCAGHPLDYAGSAEFVLPGQTNVVTVCVPVDPLDADGLEMSVTYGDPAEPDAEWIHVSLPPEGEQWAAPAQSDYGQMYRELADRTQRTGTAFGYEFSITKVDITDAGDGMATVAITLDAKFLARGAPRDVFLDVDVLGPSGTQELAGRCNPDRYMPTLDGESWQYDYCVTVPKDEADSQLLLLAQWYNAPESLTLNAHVE